MKKIIGIAAAALMALSLFACGTTTTKTTRVIDDVPYSTTRTVQHTNRHHRVSTPRVLTPRNVRTHSTVDTPNLLPYAMMNDPAMNNGMNRSVRNTTTPFNVNN